ncbi:BPSS1780 family membrane protein [Azovibrio restrictus]|uniref:BPSS1780 family membrane protein n=1 Tax=Azovibrio restrictus TaxID=146938 RepID=UPI0026EB87CE|nr:BPSS1780 family membrane protein [Azovibrio restrictus]
MSAALPFPLAPAPFTGRSRVTEPGACFDWLRQGWALFSASPGLWLGQTLLFLLGLLVPATVPLLGLLVSALLLPLLGAGMLSACQRSARGEAPAPADLLAGFRDRGGGLVLLGLLHLLGLAGITLLLWSIGNGAQQAAGFGSLLGGWLLNGLLAVILFLPLAMAFWFAPALVLFHRMSPLQALKASFGACLKNWLAFLVFGLLLSILLFFAALPLGLGFLVLIPVLFGALHASYRDIFVGV